jgi:hypothetical protein
MSGDQSTRDDAGPQWTLGLDTVEEQDVVSSKHREMDRLVELISKVLKIGSRACADVEVAHGGESKISERAPRNVLSGPWVLL